MFYKITDADFNKNYILEHSNPNHDLKLLERQWFMANFGIHDLLDVIGSGTSSISKALLDKFSLKIESAYFIKYLETHHGFQRVEFKNVICDFCRN